MNSHDLLLMGGALLAGGGAYFIFARLQPAQTPKKPKLDSLTENDALSTSLSVLGIKLHPFIVILIFASISAINWTIVNYLYPSASTSALIIALVSFVGLFIFTIDISRILLVKFEQDFLAFIETIQACLSTGMSLHSAIKFAHEHSEGAVKKESGALLNRLSLSSDIEACLTPLVERYNCETVRLFSHSVVTYSQSHCDLNDMIKGVCNMMSSRELDRQQLRAKLSGTKYAALFSGLLPYALIPLFRYKDPTWFEPLLTHESGSAFLTAAILCQLFGLLWLRLSVRVTA